VAASCNGVTPKRFADSIGAFAEQALGVETSLRFAAQCSAEAEVSGDGCAPRANAASDQPLAA
jgi:hypothetical protein